MTRRIPYIDLAAQHRPLRQELLAAFAQVLDEGHFVLGDRVTQFETEFARRMGVKYAIGVNSGTDALILALRALGIGPGDEVISAPNSFVASTAAIHLVGARPVLVDVREDYNIDPSRVAAAVTPRTKAILPVHLTGRPCDMDALGEIAERHGLHIVEDCAQAVLAAYRGRRVGSFGAIGCFSLHPLKTLNACGDGGVLTTDDEALYQQLLLLRNIGLRTREDCVLFSGNSRLDALQAALLMVKLPHLGEWTEARRENAARYRQGLAGLAEVRVPDDPPELYSVYHTVVIAAPARDSLRDYLTSVGIGSAIHYPVPIHLTQAGRTLGYELGSFPITERLAGEILSLPAYQGLLPEQVDDVCAAIRTFYKEVRR